MNSSERNDANPSSELEDNLEILRQTYFFSGLPLETLKVFAYLCTREKFKKDEYIFNQYEEDGRAFYIISGRAILERQDNGTQHRPPCQASCWHVLGAFRAPVPNPKTDTSSDRGESQEPGDSEAHEQGAAQRNRKH